MNGIIHNCTHKDSDSPTFRMTEDKMFIDIFNYVEHLFSKIKPKKLFFMAIDGVAPRAKMNQQRARRFRTALDAEKAREKAIREGVEMPKEEPFDSNCITPGTDFMARLSLHLRYFISKKVSEDINWQGVEIVLSGHEVPGEGEHKIMEYIRQAKAQQDYNPNVRHCLYGLDADLIMLGLLSHDPHFALLREEVTFGRQSKVKSKELELQNFYLLHLCLVREYLELEFQDLKEPGALAFEFDMERIIDDFILMAFFVGNDFLPNLPHLHINEGALALMFSVYRTALPKAGGYINDGGSINLQRLQLLLDELAHVEFRFFESENADAKWFSGKMVKEDVMDRGKRRGHVTMSTDQKGIFKTVEGFVQSRSRNATPDPLKLPSSLRAADRKFAQDLADDLRLQWETVEDNEGNRQMQLSFPQSLTPPDQADGANESSSEEDEEAQLALNRVLKRYQNAKIVDQSADDAQAAMEKKYQDQFLKWKNKHYEDKFGWGMDNEEEMRKLTENYVQGLQWVLFYYYRGIASWPWFYQYHYAPMISDVKLGLGANLKFDLGQPFKPFQQLMGVLPDRSKKIVPLAYHDLMVNPNSPIIDFYPREFELDMNGKKMEWEAVVKIPFIDEKRLLAAMATKEDQLTPDEKARNGFGVSLKFTYDAALDFTYPSSLPGYFPDLEHSHCVENIFDLPTMDGLEIHTGLLHGALLGSQALAGFPSLKTLPFNALPGFHGVNVFQQDSRNESMVVTITGTDARSKLDVAQGKLGKSVFVGYPFLQEAKVVQVSDELFDYVLNPNNLGQVISQPHDARGIETWKKKANFIENSYSKKLGIIIGDVETTVHVEMLKGLLKKDDGATIKEFGPIASVETDYAAQILVDEVYSADQRFLEKAALPIEEEFPEGSRAFFLGDYAYGRPLAVLSHTDGKTMIHLSKLQGPEPEFGHYVVQQSLRGSPYKASYQVARLLQLHPLALSKITASLSVNSQGLRLNLGLNLKFESKKEKVLGYSRKTESGWEYSQKAIDLISEYMIKFPEFIAGICQKPSGDIYQDTDFYPKETAAAKMKEIGQWLKSIQSKSFERVPLEAEQLDSEAVAQIEQAALANLANSKHVFEKMGGVPRHCLLNPADAQWRVGNQRFALGDRVVYVLSAGRVPIAQRGTVVGMTRTSRQTLLDVVFDTSFISGSTLGDRCSPFHGSTVPSDSVLNLSNKQLAVMSRAGQQRAPAPTQGQPLAIRGSFNRPVGPNGLGQSMPANAPPPLAGAWNAAASGQNYVNGHNPLPGRGRGRAGFANTTSRGGGQRGGPTQNGTAPRGGRGRGGSGTLPANNHGGAANSMSTPPANYNNVPPPPSLTDSGRGRGRGRGRGGGGRGRGAQPAAQSIPSA
jgi:5'-3' exoribonuclease 1